MIYKGNEIQLIQNKFFKRPQYLGQSPSLPYFEQQVSNRDECIQIAYNSEGFSMADLATFGLHYSRISRIVNKSKLKMNY
jgi:hypothetical protein